jgi:predicted acetyltransferase
VLDIRQPTERDREAIALVLGLAFNSVANPDRVSLERSLCAYDGERVVGTCVALDLDQWFGGSPVACAGIASVTVLPEYRGRGAASAMMRSMLQQRRDDGDAISTLYPANTQLYRRLGYEFGGLRPQFNAELTDLPTVSTELAEVREMADGDMAALMACYARFAAGHNGPIFTADPVVWAGTVLAHKGEGTHQRTVLVPGPLGVEGYASYFLDRWEDRGYAINCKHLVALTPGALRALLGHFRRFENAARDFVWHGPPSTLPVGLALATGAFSLLTKQLRWMVRLLDVPKALEARGYPGVSGGAVIGIDDPLFPANAGPWLVEVADGRAQVTPAAHRAEPTAAAARPLSIGLFSALYTGMATPADLVLAGALDDDDPRLPVLTALFGGPAPWMLDSF